MKVSTIIKSVAVSALAVLVIAAPTFAAMPDNCVNPVTKQGESAKYPNLSTSADGQTPTGFPVKCPIKVDGKVIYGKTAGDCAAAGSIATNPEACGDQGDLNNIVRTIINTIIFVIGIVAVFMIILGGISYATSQGDANKVKKGKDTILYGIIGLVIALLAFAIVSFVLSALQN